LNSKVLFAAVFIAMLATTAAYASPAVATSAPQNESAPQRQMTLSIPGSLLYDVNGTLIAWVNASGHAVISSNIPGLHSYSVTINKLYIGVRISAAVHNINVSTSTGIVTGDIAINARLVIKVDMNLNGTAILQDVDQSFSTTWFAELLIPTGTTKNFSIPFPAIESIDPTSGTGSPDPIKIKFTDDNDTWTGTKYVVNHVQWDFSNWLQNKIQDGLNSVWGKAATALQQANIPGIQGGFSVVNCVGKIDLWKTSGTSPDNILLMAGGFINLLIDFSVVGNGHLSFSAGGNTYTVNYDINFFAEFGLYLGLAVTSDWQFRTAEAGGDWSLNEYVVQVPENATLVWKKVGVIVYYGSYATQVDVTGGASQGSTHFGGSTMFFVDYGWDGVPDFATNGTGQPVHLPDETGTTSGSGTSRTVNLSTKNSTGTWIYFELDVTGYAVVDVKRNDGVTLNATQYWVFTDGLGNGMLYVCDDPAYSYTVELTPLTAGGLPMSLLLIGAVAVVAVVAGLLVLTRRKSSSSVSIK
jgi:hypothetical protein